MEASAKKRKVEENGAVDITVEDTRKMLEPFTREQLLDILQEAATKHLEVLEQVRSIADKDPAQRKLFVRGLGWDTNTKSLKARLDRACVEESMTSSGILFSILCSCRYLENFIKCMLFYQWFASFFMLNAHVQNVKFVIIPKMGKITLIAYQI